MRVLLVEDNLTIAKGLKYSFEKNGYEAVCMSTVKDTKEYLAENPEVDLAVLDVALPDGNGFLLYESHIGVRSIPTLFLTAKDEEDNVVKGLTMGAEDYMTKPFSTKELMARVNKILLRNRKQSEIKVQDITFDMDKMTVRRGEEQLEFSSLELKLLHLLFLNRNKVLSREVILDKIWEWTGNDVDDHTVTVYMKRIRSKLGTDIITTVKGIGYRIDDGK